MTNEELLEQLEKIMEEGTYVDTTGWTNQELIDHFTGKKRMVVKGMTKAEHDAWLLSKKEN